MSFSSFFLLLAFQSRLSQGQIEEIPYASVGTSQLYAVITGVLDIWCEMGMVTFSVCLLAHPSSHRFCPRPPPRPFTPSPQLWGVRQEAHFRGKCEVCLSASWCPGTWSNIYWPNGALSLLWSNDKALLMGPAVQGKTRQRAKGVRLHTLYLFITLYLTKSSFCAQASSNINCIWRNIKFKTSLDFDRVFVYPEMKQHRAIYLSF